MMALTHRAKLAVKKKYIYKYRVYIAVGTSAEKLERFS